MMGIVVHSRSTGGTCSPWWHLGSPGIPSPWQQRQALWWGWQRRATGRRATGWQSCPGRRRATRQRPTGHTHPAETQEISSWFHDSEGLSSLCRSFSSFYRNMEGTLCDSVSGECCNYPKEQVEEEEHVFNAADAAASHDCTDRHCKRRN